jgi:hypothetical protein
MQLDPLIVGRFCRYLLWCVDGGDYESESRLWVRSSCSVFIFL